MLLKKSKLWCEFFVIHPFRNGETLIVKSHDALARHAENVVIFNYLTKEDSETVSLARAQLSGLHGPTVNPVSDRVYYVLTGEAVVMIDDRESLLKSGDMAFIRSGQRHSISGEAEYLVLNSPPFDPADEQPES